MLVLINTNRMKPPIAPIGLDYVAGAAEAAGLVVRVIDPCVADDPDPALRRELSTLDPRLVGLTFRNVDDCFWPSARWFVPDLQDQIRTIRSLTGAPIVLGGVGFSVMPQRLMDLAGADFGIHGDGEQAIVSLYKELTGDRRFERVPGLLWRDKGGLKVNPPSWEADLRVPAGRRHVDNAAYFRLGGQGSLETKRGCDQPCLYCADPLAKGRRIRVRPPPEVADEAESLLRQGVNVLHLCDGEFNMPLAHAKAVCEEFVRRGLGGRLTWYAYLSILPFDAELAALMRQAGCVGINFTTDSAAPAMLRSYCHTYTREDIAATVGHARKAGIKVMLDLLLGGPGETPETVADTIRFIQSLDVYAVGSALGVRVYEGTGMEAVARRESGSRPVDPIRRRYDGPLDFARSTFYISPHLGERPAARVRELIGKDERFFAPADDSAPGSDHNYSDNTPLLDAIAAGARGAYWDILRTIRR
jgi:radical SAM superfamily enzyme YgiQ (UPF0313 family)